jgi:hypothetical protein
VKCAPGSHPRGAAAPGTLPQERGRRVSVAVFPAPQFEERIAGASATDFAAGCPGLRKRSSRLRRGIGRCHAEQLHPAGAGDGDDVRRAEGSVSQRRVAPSSSIRSRSRRHSLRVDIVEEHREQAGARRPRAALSAASRACGDWRRRRSCSPAPPAPPSRRPSRCTGAGDSEMRLLAELGAQLPPAGPARAGLGAGQHQRVELQHGVRTGVLPLLGLQAGDAPVQLGHLRCPSPSRPAASSSAGSGRDARRARSAARG